MRRIDRFDKYMKFKGLNDNKVTVQLGLSVGTLSKSRKEGRDLSDKVIEQILNFYPDLNKVWLLAGEGDMFVFGGKNKEPKIETRPRIPMAAAAGTLTGFTDSVYMKDCEQIPVIQAFPSYDYTMLVKGNSMEPKFEGGDEIAIRKVNAIIEWGKTYVLDTRDGAVIKRLYDDGECFRCVSYNNEYPDFLVRKEDVFGVYKVVGLIRV